VPPFRQGYSIMFGTLDFYVLMKRFVMIYERFVIARRQIDDKLREDLADTKTTDLIFKEANKV
jgi:hypothetical protein